MTAAWNSLYKWAEVALLLGIVERRRASPCGPGLSLAPENKRLRRDLNSPQEAAAPGPVRWACGAFIFPKLPNLGPGAPGWFEQVQG